MELSLKCIILQVHGIKHSGKARRGDGNDLTANPKKLAMIGKELDKINKVISFIFNCIVYWVFKGSGVGTLDFELNTMFKKYLCFLTNWLNNTSGVQNFQPIF